jgi:hypothetical protein
VSADISRWRAFAKCGRQAFLDRVGGIPVHGIVGIEIERAVIRRQVGGRVPEPRSRTASQRCRPNTSATRDTAGGDCSCSAIPARGVCL